MNYSILAFYIKTVILKKNPSSFVDEVGSTVKSIAENYTKPFFEILLIVLRSVCSICIANRIWKFPLKLKRACEMILNVP